MSTSLSLDVVLGALALSFLWLFVMPAWAQAEAPRWDPLNTKIRMDHLGVFAGGDLFFEWRALECLADHCREALWLIVYDSNTHLVQRFEVLSGMGCGVNHVRLLNAHEIEILRPSCGPYAAPSMLAERWAWTGHHFAKVATQTFTPSDEAHTKIRHWIDRGDFTAAWGGRLLASETPFHDAPEMRSIHVTAAFVDHLTTAILRLDALGQTQDAAALIAALYYTPPISLTNTDGLADVVLAPRRLTGPGGPSLALPLDSARRRRLLSLVSILERAGDPLIAAELRRDLGASAPSARPPTQPTHLALDEALARVDQYLARGHLIRARGEWFRVVGRLSMDQHLNLDDVVLPRFIAATHHHARAAVRAGDLEHAVAITAAMLGLPTALASHTDPYPNQYVLRPIQSFVPRASGFADLPATTTLRDDLRGLARICQQYLAQTPSEQRLFPDFDNLLTNLLEQIILLDPTHTPAYLGLADVLLDTAHTPNKQLQQRVRGLYAHYVQRMLQAGHADRVPARVFDVLRQPVDQLFCH